jgi:hypothetical protein
MFVGNAEHALDARRITNADLDVGLIVEARPLIDLAALCQKDALYGIERLKEWSGRSSHLMKMVDDRAIEFAKQKVWSAAILRDRLSGLIGNFDKIFVSRLYGGYARRGCQVEAIAEIKNGADDKRLGEFLASFLFLGELESAQRIGFPEIDARSEPIPRILAGNKLRGSIEKRLRNILITSVIAKHECSREIVHGRAQS